MADGVPTYDSIIIGGERVKLANNVTVKTWEDPDGYSFPAANEDPAVMAKTGGIPLYGNRSFEKKKAKTIEEAAKAIHQVVLHTDLTMDSKVCFDVLVARGLSTHFMIDWDGVIFQGLDPLYQAFHAGDANNGSIGVDLNNYMKNLVREPDAPMYYQKHSRIAEMQKKEFRRQKSPKMRINGAEVRSYGYTDAQYLSLIELLKALIKKLPRIQPFPPMDEKGEVIPNMLEDAVGFEGFLAHWHITGNRWDPGPGFDWQRVRHALASEHNAFPVEIEPGVNVATLLEEPKVKAHADKYIKRIESATGGGYYPVGINQTWHGGVHVRAEKGKEVKAMFDGVLVAGHMQPQPTRLGSNNFLLLRHQVDIPTRIKGKARSLIFYSLYMHLEYVDVTMHAADDAPQWVRELYKIHSGVEEDEEGALGSDKPASEDATDGDGLIGDGDETGLEELEPVDDDGDEGEEFSEDNFLKIGQHLGAFKRGWIALVPWQENPIKISSGETIARMGEFGKPNEWTSQVHVEVFAEKSWKEAIDLGVHGRFFVEVESDLTSNLFVKNRDIVRLFDPPPRPKKRSLVPYRVIAPDDIEYFYNSSEYEESKRMLRRAVTRHVSEWSDEVDWVAALSDAEDWKSKTRDFKAVIKQSGIFKSALENVLPFIWFTKEVAQHIGMNVDAWDGVVYHFHPIHFLVWLTYHSNTRIRVVSRGLTLNQIKRRIKKRKKELEKMKKEGMQTGERSEDYGALLELEDIDEPNTEAVLEEFYDRLDQGDWKWIRPEEGY